VINKFNAHTHMHITSFFNNISSTYLLPEWIIQSKGYTIGRAVHLRIVSDAHNGTERLVGRDETSFVALLRGAIARLCNGVSED
jgi:hypothetical protein